MIVAFAAHAAPGFQRRPCLSLVFLGRPIQHAIWLYLRFTLSYSDVGTGSKRAERSVTDNEPNREGAVRHPMIVRYSGSRQFVGAALLDPFPSDTPPNTGWLRPLPSVPIS